MRPCPTLHFGPFALDGPDNGLWRGPQRCKLTAKAEAVLRYLIEHPGRLVHKADLLAAVWPDVHVSEWVLTTCIRELRQVLGDAVKTPQYIATVHGQGYRFIAPVTVAEAPPLSVSATPPQPLLPPPSTPEMVLPAPTGLVLDAEYKLVTVLCAAVADAPVLGTRLGPEAWYRLLQTVVGWAQDVIRPYDGTLTLPTSEGFTVVFGTPVAQEDHARRAVLAAWELHQRLRQPSALRAQSPGGGLALRLGLHSGLVVVGKLGQAPQHSDMAVGAPFHVATRLQQQAAPGTTLLSAGTYRLVQAEVQAAPCGTLALEGQPIPLSVYTVQGLRGRHAGVMGRGPRTGSPFVGRARELALLHDCLATVRTGQGQVVGLVGEPGLGKTRLVMEFCRSLAGQEVTVVVGQCLSYGQATPYLPVRDLLRQVCGLAEGDVAAVQHRLHASGIAAEEDVALLLHLLDLPVEPECLARLSPEARQVRTFALLRHLLVHVAQPQPLVLVVENVHWIDPTSAAWLLSLVERLAGAAILLVGTCRPGAPLPWGTHAVGTQVALPPLRDQDSRAVVQAVLGAAILPEARVQALLAQAGGNPFFLEELAWHTVAHEQPDTPGAVPETVQAVLVARMDRLPPAAKRLLQVAAVVGMDVSFPLLQALAEQPEERLQQSLAHLQAAEFLYETRLFPEQEYTFKHALTHEVAYGSLLLERRRVLHARLVEVLEVLAPDWVTEQVERLAHHALRGEVWDKAVTYCQQAGASAFDHAAFREAVASFEQALQALAHLPEDRDTRVRAIELRLVLVGVLGTLGEHGRRLALLGEAEALARACDDRTRLCQVLTQLGQVYRMTGDHDGAIAVGQQALDLAAVLGDSALQVQASYFLGQAYAVISDFGRAAELLRWSVEAADKESGRPSTARIGSRARLARLLGALGAFAEGRRHGEEAFRLATLAGRGLTPIMAHGCLGRLSLAQGDLEHAIRLLEQGLALCRASDARSWLQTIAGSLGFAYGLQGRLTEGRALLEEGISESIRTGDLQGQASRVAWLSEVCRLTGYGEEAGQHARQALDLARHQKVRGDEAQALYQLGVVYAHTDPPDAAQAESYYQQALALAEELGMRPLQAHCHRGLGTLYAATGQREQARTALITAIDLYRTMEMTFWLPQAEAALAQVT
jgi:DNA-binding winged helix-turn-helix (wHTH) protein/tetratricopeptide (TPR) repeat protein